ncbi:hypothetical protein [Chryseobacterium sp.]|nr:hypothetical protein [Chryseobacterium sp.]
MSRLLWNVLGLVRNVKFEVRDVVGWVFDGGMSVGSECCLNAV